MMVATHILWRWRSAESDFMGWSWIETTEPGQRCDWVSPNHVYVQLGWAVPVKS